MVVAAVVLLVVVLAFSLVLFARLARQVHADPSYLARAVHWRGRRRSFARPR